MVLNADTLERLGEVAVDGSAVAVQVGRLGDNRGLGAGMRRCV